MNVAEISAREAARRPHKEAIVDPVRGRRVTYAELERRVAALARALDADARVERGDRVVMLATNCVEYFEVYFAAARAAWIDNCRDHLPSVLRWLPSTAPAGPK